jgi:hypothetical protein
MESRRFHRVSFSAHGELNHHELTYHVRIENISLRGALLSSDECIMVPLGETCRISFSPGDGTPPIVVTAEVVHCFFSMVGVKFVEFPEDAERRVFDLMERITTKPEELEREWAEILGHKAVQIQAA